MLRQKIERRVSRVIRSQQLILGPEMRKFEKNWANYCGASHCVAVANGTDALELALRACGVGPGDEVIVPSRTFIATWMAVSNVGATPISCPTYLDSGLIKPASIKPLINAKTRAIIAVHLYGHPADLDAIHQAANSHGLTVIEDAAQAHGATYRGKRIGAHSSVVTWSFYPGKNLGAFGDAGAITTNQSSIAQKLKLLRNYGSEEKYIHQVVGRNSRLDEVQAAILSAKLSHLNSDNKIRRKIANQYLAGLSNSRELMAAGIQLPQEATGSRSSWHLFVIRAPHRDYLERRLREFGVETLVHYPTDPSNQLAYSAGAELGKGTQPWRNDGNTLLSLPMGPHLKKTQVQHVIKCVKIIASEIVSNHS